MYKVKFLFLISTIFITVSCVDTHKYDLTPKIEFVGIDKFEVEDQLGRKLQVRITLSFDDDDGDLGEDAQLEERRAILQSNGGWGNYHAQVLRFVNNKRETYEMLNHLLDIIIHISE